MNLNRDMNIIEKMLDYCNQIEEANTTFHRSYETFKVNSVYKNAVCLCLMQILFHQGLQFFRLHLLYEQR